MWEIFPTVVYSLCFLTSALCAFLLGRMYRRVGARMLFWSAACFALLALTHAFTICDLVLFPNIDFRPARTAATLAAVSVLLFGFIWDQES